MPKTAYIAAHKGTTYILELARAGSTKLNASAMPTIGREGDRLVPLNTVPLHIRRAARAHLGVS